VINYTIYENKTAINGSLLSMEPVALLYGLNKYVISKQYNVLLLDLRGHGDSKTT
jgi:pimeloyl-ACP methyl ester carboxylesterase